jgi:TonB family protein
MQSPLASTQAKLIYARALIEGLGGLAQNAPEGLKILEQTPVSRSKILQAQYHVEGVFFAIDYGKARRYLNEAATMGDTNAYGLLGQIYEKGLGVDKNDFQARRYYVRAAKYQDAKAKAWVIKNPTVSEPYLQSFWLQPSQVLMTPKVVIDNQNSKYQSLYSFIVSGLDRSYPMIALRKKIEAYALIECTVSVKANIENCIILDESPKNEGFAKNALRAITRAFVLEDPDAFITATRDKAVIFSLRYKIG